MSVPDWTAKQLADLAANQPFGNGRVRLGVAFDAWYLPKDDVISLFENARGLGVKLFTTHYVRNPIFGTYSRVFKTNFRELIYFGQDNIPSWISSTLMDY